jgi:hypothetical protein
MNDKTFEKQIIKRISSRFNQFYTPSIKIEWHDASPFIIGLHSDPIFNSVTIAYGKFNDPIKHSGFRCKKEIGCFQFHRRKSIIYYVNFRSTIITLEEVISFLDAIPDDLALCINIPWAKPLIELVCKNN